MGELFELSSILATDHNLWDHNTKMNKISLSKNNKNNSLQDKLESLQFRYHGKYGGPNYSGGKFGAEANFEAEPEDRLDSVFRKHDLDYAAGKIQHGDEDLLYSLGSVLGWDNFHKVLPAAAGFELKRSLGFSKDKRRVDPAHNSKMHALNGNIKTGKVKSLIRKVENKMENSSPMLVRNKTSKKDHAKFVAATKRERAPDNSSVIQGSSHAPMLRPFKAMPKSVKGNTSVRVSGSELYCTVSTASSANPGAVLHAADLDLFKTGSPLTSYAGMYSRYKIHKLVAEYVPTVGNSTAGTLVATFTVDPDDILVPDSFDFVRTLLSRTGSKPFQVHERTTVVRPPTSQAYFCPGSGHDLVSDQRLEIAGQLLIVSVAGTANLTSYGTIILHYDMEFMDASVTNTPVLSLSGASGSTTWQPSVDTSNCIFRSSLRPTTFNIPAGIYNPDPTNDQSTQRWKVVSPYVNDFTPSYLLLPPGRYGINVAVQFATSGTGVAWMFEVWSPTTLTWTAISSTSTNGVAGNFNYSTATAASTSLNYQYMWLAITEGAVFRDSSVTSGSSGMNTPGALVRLRLQATETRAVSGTYCTIRQSKPNAWATWDVNGSLTVAPSTTSDRLLALEKRLASLDLSTTEPCTPEEPLHFEEDPLTNSVHISRFDVARLRAQGIVLPSPSG